jgi:RimJ/RimL family protein N-acetyltransferase
MDPQELRGPFKGRTTRVRPMTLEDTDHVVAWRNDPAISRWFFGEVSFTADGHRTWLTKRLGSDTDLNWIIEDETGRPIGAVAVYGIDWSSGIAEFGRLAIGEASASGKGHAGEAVGLVVRAAKAAGLNTLFLEVKPDNKHAIALYRRKGFRETSAKPGAVRMELPLDGVS